VPIQSFDIANTSLTSAISRPRIYNRHYLFQDLFNYSRTDNRVSNSYSARPPQHLANVQYQVGLISCWPPTGTALLRQEVTRRSFACHIGYPVPRPRVIAIGEQHRDASCRRGTQRAKPAESRPRSAALVPARQRSAPPELALQR